jgi:cell wall-associated NlpC family hydrolase
MRELTVQEIDAVIACAQACVGVVKYRLGACLAEVPLGIADCSVFVQWCAQSGGVYLPRYSWEQYGAREVRHIDSQECRRGDLVFLRAHPRKPLVSLLWRQVGHVGVMESQDVIIHATRRDGCVVRTYLHDIAPERNPRFARMLKAA